MRALANGCWAVIEKGPHLGSRLALSHNKSHQALLFSFSNVAVRNL